MTTEKRNEIIIKEIELAKQTLIDHHFYCGSGAFSDIFKLSDGREAQIQLNVTIDVLEFKEPTHSFVKSN